PWVTDFQKYKLINIYDSFYSSTAGVTESDITELEEIKFMEVTVNDSARKFVSEGRLSQIPAGVFNLDVVSLDEGRMVDFSKYAYLPLPGYLQIERPGKTIPQIVEEETRKNPKMLLAAINGSNADWSAPNAFLIKDGEFITKPVPGTNQKERAPLLGNFSILAFDDNNRAKVTNVNIEYDKLVTDENIHYGIQGQVILEDGKIYPSPPKPEMIGYPQENEVGFNTVTKIRASFSAIGITEDGSIMLITMIGKINVPAVANLLKQAGAKDAILLGGSGDAQQVTFSADPVLAEERRDKPLIAGTYSVRPVNMGLMFFSNSITTYEMTNRFVKSILNQLRNKEIIETSL
ncbi:phosphodiester glycosidase family protein, partial [bacterium]|nr:phosphodiester glycosidase family protein [bacterium]